jgi:peptide/nickel transport system ATP-binding protein/oligopeptide transport system ATP-binding protein
VWQRRGVTAVDHVSVSLEPGRTIAVVGESGSGKSTLARLLLNLEQPDAGTVSFDGMTLSAMSEAETRAYRQAVQMVFQHPQQSFNPMLTIGSSVKDALRLRDDLSRSQKDRTVRELLSLVGLDPVLAARRRRELSGGELQRAALARALASQPRLLILDEPTPALDASIRGQIIELLLRFQEEEGLGYLVVTHDMRLVQMMADHVLVMYLGQIVEEGPTDAVLRQPLHPYTRSLVKAAALEGGTVRAAVRGEISELPEGYKGCRFYSRCPFATQGCLEPQALATARRAHSVRCWRWEEIESQSE